MEKENETTNHDLLKKISKVKIRQKKNNELTILII